jgi:SNF2 family DNA or RNA helicase
VLSARLSARLFPHQREGVAWLWGRHAAGRGGILGDDMARTPGSTRRSRPGAHAD